MATRKTDSASGAGSPVLEALRVPFPLDAVKTRPGGGGKSLDYVAIETVLARLLEVAPEYSWTGEVVSFEDGCAVVAGQLSVGDKTAFGVGAMKNPDPDMAVKSANSEAIKNAAKNGFGVALELWSAEYREQLAKRRSLSTAAAMKQEVFRLAKTRLEKSSPTVKDIAALFGVAPGDLSDEDTLRNILIAEGVL